MNGVTFAKIKLKIKKKIVHIDIYKKIVIKTIRVQFIALPGAVSFRRRSNSLAGLNRSCGLFNWSLGSKKSIIWTWKCHFHNKGMAYIERLIHSSRFICNAKCY